MNLIHQNPYRIIGVLSNISQRELIRHKTKIKRYQDVGREVSSDYVFPFLNSISTENKVVENAFSKIEQNKSKVLNSLFWFANGNSFDKTAIDYLKIKNADKALEIWEKVTDGKEISDKNFTSFNNLGTLYLVFKTELMVSYDVNRLKKGILLKLRLIESKSFASFIKLVADENYCLSEQEATHLFIDELTPHLERFFNLSQSFSSLFNELTSEVKSLSSDNSIINLFNDTTKIANDYIIKKLSSDIIYSLETTLNKTIKKRESNKLNAYELGEKLYSTTQVELTHLESILGVNNSHFQLLADNIAQEILQCAIDYFNENDKIESSHDYLNQSLELANLAQEVAVIHMTKERIMDNIHTLEEMKDKDVNQAIELLRIIENTYEKNKKKIEDEVKRLERTDIDIILGNKVIDKELVVQNVRNSINWLKVIDDIEKVITKKTLEKIKINPDLLKQEEYKRLVEFLDSKIPLSLKSKVNYLKYWKIDNSILADMELKILNRVATRDPLRMGVQSVVDEKASNFHEVSELLSKQNNYQWLKSRVVYERNRLEDIKKWKLFRTLRTREKQILKQVSRINYFKEERDLVYKEIMNKRKKK